MKKIGYDYHVDIEFQEKEGGIIQFTIVACSRDRANNVVQHIQGEFCNVSYLLFSYYYMCTIVC